MRWYKIEGLLISQPANVLSCSLLFSFIILCVHLHMEKEQRLKGILFLVTNRACGY